MKMKRIRSSKRLKRFVPPSEKRMCALSCRAVLSDLTAEATENGQRPRFSIVAYTGGAVNVGYGRPVVFDLAGLRYSQRIPILLDHDSTQIVGQTTRVIVSDDQISMEGLVTADDDIGEKVVVHSRNGFQWAASVGIIIHRLEAIDGGTSVKVNGRSFDGPVYVVRSGRLGETSFVSIGADEHASARIAASLFREVCTMSFDQWLIAGGLVPGELTDSERAKLEAAYEATTHMFASSSSPDNSVNDGGGGDAVPSDGGAAAAALDEIRAEAKRVAEITRLCATGDYGDLQMRAVAEGWSVEKTKYEVRIASLSAGPPNVIRGSAAPTVEILEAAVRLGSGEQEALIAKSYRPEVLDRAYAHRRIGIRDFIRLAAAAGGRPAPEMNSAPVHEWVTAAFSTATVPGILSSAANKMLMSAFSGVDPVARTVMKKLSANDFKTHTGYRLASNAGMELTGPGGELKHLNFTETSFQFRVDSYGSYIGLTRQQWINDDLGAFTQVPLIAGRNAAQRIESVAWATVIANAGSFFSTNNRNYIEGADTNLSVAGLSKAVQTMREQQDSRGNRISIRPRYLVVPPALEFDARSLYVSDSVVATGVGNAKQLSPAANVFRGSYEPMVPPHLAGQPKVWYLFADPADVAAFGIAYLNAVEAPTVEQVEPNPDTLGFAWRAYIDFGVCQIDPQGAVKSKGEA